MSLNSPTHALSALKISDTVADSAAPSVPSSTQTSTSASLAGRSVAKDASPAKEVPGPKASASTLPPDFKAKFGSMGEALANALPVFSIDLVSVVAGYLRPEFDPELDLKPADKSVHDKFDPYLPALNEKGVLSHQRKGWPSQLCAENPSSLLQRGRYAVYSTILGLYHHIEKPGIVLCISKTKHSFDPSIPGETYLLISEEALMAFIEKNNIKKL